MERTTIIIAGYKFSKSELVELFDDFAATSPLGVRTEAWQVAEAINELDKQALEQTLKGLRLLNEVRTLRNEYARADAIYESIGVERSPQGKDKMTSALIRAIAKEVLR